jgi:multidrug efflux pump
MAGIERDLPVGITVHRVANQPEVVEESVHEFSQSLAERSASCWSCRSSASASAPASSWRLSVPLVLAITFVGMMLLGIDFQRISARRADHRARPAVDDAIIAVEMMMVKLEQGFSRMEAATYAYTSTAFPMLTGTPDHGGRLRAGRLRQVERRRVHQLDLLGGRACPLVISWFVAVLFTPWIGYRLLPTPKAGAHHDPYGGRLYTMFRAAVTWCLTWRWVTIGVTALAFVGRDGLVRPGAEAVLPDRQPARADRRPPAGAGRLLWRDRRRGEEARAVARPEPRRRALHLVYRSGLAALLPADGARAHQLELRQVIVLDQGPRGARAVVGRAGQRCSRKDFEAVRAACSGCRTARRFAYPVMFRVLGEDPQKVRAVAEQVRQVFKADPDTRDVNFDWNELAKSVRLDVDQAKARAAGHRPSQLLSNALQTILSGVIVTQYREGVETIDVGRPCRGARALSVEGLESIHLRTATGGIVSLASSPRCISSSEEPILWRRNKELLMTVRAGVTDGVQGPDVATRLDKALEPVRASLPPGYRIEVGGDKEESAKSQGSIFKMMPVMAFLTLLFLMLQLRSFSKLALVLLTRPLGHDRRGAVPAAVQPAVRLRVAARHHRAGRHDHAQLGDPGRPDRPGHRRGPRRVGRRDRRHGAPRPADPAHRRHRDLRHGPAVAQRVLGADGRGADGRPAGRDRAHPALPAGALRRVVPGEAAPGSGRRAPIRHDPPPLALAAE